MKYLIRVVVVLFLMTGSAQLAKAQGASVYFGLGTAVDSSSGQPIDTFGNGTLYNTPKMGGLFENVGGDVMFRPHLGVGFETSFRSQSNYAGLNYRPFFYDFNAIYQPISTRGWWCRNFKPGWEARISDFTRIKAIAIPLGAAQIRTITWRAPITSSCTFPGACGFM